MVESDEKDERSGEREKRAMGIPRAIENEKSADHSQMPDASESKDIKKEIFFL